jgi:gliding motility-associated protein GldC
MKWSAQDGQIHDNTASAFLLSIWDPKEKNTMKIDLWTKDMMVDEMADFYFQAMMTMADTFQRATNQPELSAEMKTFARGFLKKFKETQTA